VAAVEVRAEMVANVAEVKVAVGDAVKKGDVLVIVESMKMEIPVLSETDGKITKVGVHKGEVVQAGDLMVVIA
jgi:biotin carboxyl carrier protein